MKRALAGTDPSNRIEGTVMSLPVGIGTPTTLASSQNIPKAIVVDPVNVCWTDLGRAGQGTVMKVTPK
jgi:hypothetical protein